ncbi:hypothetical protein KSB_22160 [Ktedonobacter robiniae]|uniref:CheW-like domain-containing protein n=1 Tax=Ktedonobacter robiniae TaxID=2778365 RepID=A0ABQ3ULX3_9CHLR|nr:hypothetical protein KSB_22160 [Ktedonobacter robiniae]
MRPNDPNASQAFPLMLRVEIGQDFRITQGPIFANFQSTVTFLHLSIHLPVRAGKAIFFRESKRRLHLVKQVPVIVFESQGIVAVLLDNLLGNLGLRPIASMVTMQPYAHQLL